MAVSFFSLDTGFLSVIYPILRNPFFIVGFVLIVCVVIWIAFKQVEKREKSSRKFFDLMFDRQRREKPHAQSSKDLEKDALEGKLKSKADSLKGVEGELKDRKRIELAGREKMLRRKELEEKVKRQRKLKQREISLLRQAHTDRISTHDWIKPGGVGFDSYKGYDNMNWGLGNDSYGLDERNRIKGLIDSALNSYHKGELDEGGLSKTVLDYQRQLLEIEIRSKRSSY